MGPAAPVVAAQYPLATFPSADLAFAAAGTDAAFACPALGADFSMSAFVPLSTYEFNDENAPQDFLPPVTFPYAAAHASELLKTLASGADQKSLTALVELLGAAALLSKDLVRWIEGRDRRPGRGRCGGRC